MQLKNIFALAALMTRYGLRNNVILGLVLVSFFLQACALFFFNFVPRDIGMVTSDYVVSIGWIGGMLFIFFHGVSALSWGENQRAIHTLLSTPISRTEYVFGMFAGLLFLLFLLNTLLALLGYGILLLAKSIAGIYFIRIGIPEYLLAWWGVFSIEAMILSVLLLFSGLIRGTASVFTVTLSYYLICSGLPVAIEFLKQDNVFMRKFLEVLTLIFPNFSRFDYKGIIAVFGEWPSLQTLSINTAYTLLYVALILIFAAGVYGERDLK
ncbi:hypothetical protein LJC24_03765 [Desulfococcaceae bacterium OttesenSCG-928-F15]|nr:hypothetical protein [Desulfococcaceae bacterium OttesenSCG-928-F15]